jgi:hypothetical protein
MCSQEGFIWDRNESWSHKMAKWISAASWNETKGCLLESNITNQDTTIHQQAVANRGPYLANNVQPIAKQKVVVSMYADTQQR